MPVSILPLYYIVQDVAAAPTDIVITHGSTALQVSTVQIRLVYAGTSSADISLPGLDQVADIAASVGDIVTVSIGGVRMLRGDIVDFGLDGSVRDASVNLDVQAAIPFSQSGSVAVTDIISRSISAGQKSFQAGFNGPILPGQTVTTAFDEFIAGEVQYVIGADNATVTVTELTADDEARRETAESSGAQFYFGVRATNLTLV